MNLVLRTRAQERAPQLVDEVRTAHRGRMSRWMVTPTWDHTALEVALDRGGYAPDAEHAAAVLSTGVELKGGAFEVRRVRDWQGLLDWTSVVLSSFPASREPPSTSDLEDALALCTAPDSRVARFVAYDDGEPISAGGLSAFTDMSLGLLWAGATLPAARGRGAYRAILAARVALARAMGLDHVGLFAKTDTSSPIVARAGFTLYGTMTVWACRP